MQPTRTIRSLVLSCFAGFLIPLSAATVEDLWKAAGAGQTAALAAVIDAGVDVNARNPDGLTALMLAAKAGSFPCCRELLWAKANPALVDRQGHPATTFVEDAQGEGLPLAMLLRCYAYIARHGHPNTALPARPGLVMIMENTVNYLHPSLKTAYLVNEKELNGKPGVDDDGDGFVDDVYGWEPVTNRPYTIRPAQFEAYKTNREAIARILAVDRDRAQGKLSPADAETILADWTNPLAAIMGPQEQLSDKAFLNMVKQAAHGTHVAGIILAASDGKAQLHTMAVDFSEESVHPFGRQSAKVVADLVAAAKSPEDLLTRYQELLTKTAEARARIGSGYLQKMGASVVNMSYGGQAGFYKGIVIGLLRAYLERRQAAEPEFTIEDDEAKRLVGTWPLELYAAAQVQTVLLMADNPQVLFVVAAGNDKSDNDSDFVTPAYFSRFFPNVITIASCNDKGGISDFTNFGPLSVDVAAPGEDIESTVIPEASLYMSGTSMATPYVAGTAARLRTLYPKLTAAEVRRSLSYTVRFEPSHGQYTATSGVVDPGNLLAYYGTDPKAKALVLAKAARTTCRISDDNFPRSTPDALTLSKAALELDGSKAEIWLARAVAVGTAGYFADSLKLTDKVLAMGGIGDDVLMFRFNLFLKLKRQPDALTALSAAIDLLAKAGEPADLLRARRLLLRSQLENALGRKEDAERDAAEAFKLDPELAPKPAKTEE